MNDLRRSSCPLLDDVCGDCESTAIGKPLMGEKEKAAEVDLYRLLWSHEHLYVAFAILPFP
jgi:hypothetical protein